MAQNTLEDSQNLSTLRNIKIGSFHIGSSMADILGSGVWNRIMKEELGQAATPVSIVLALRYFLAPLAAWAGERSDYTNLRGYRRLPWVIGGRLAMIAGYMLVAFATIELARHGAIWWIGIVLGFLMVSLGGSVSGSTFLALVYDRAPSDQRGRAVGVVWTFLLAGYAVAGVVFARMLPDYNEGAFLRFFVAVGLMMLLIWVFALWGEEKRRSPQYIAAEAAAKPKPDFKADLRGIMESRSARLLAAFMMFSFVAAFMQDVILEPFGGEIFGMSVGETTRFAAYWGTMAIVSSVAALALRRKLRGYGYLRFSRWGVWVMTFTFALLALTAFGERAALLRPALIMLGIGYGLWNIGTVGLMVDNSRESNAGLDLGVWTVIATVCRGGGVLLGGILLDLFEWGLRDAATAYGLVFTLEAALLVVSLFILNQMVVSQVSHSEAQQEREMILSASMD